jgi:hypothetical protein
MNPLQPKLSESTIKAIEAYYTNYVASLRDPEFARLDRIWTRNGTKESAWIQIYNQRPIPEYLAKLLFSSGKSDDETLISELDALTVSMGK